MRLRPIVRLVLCCLLCLTVCVAPVFANDIEANVEYSGTYGYIARVGQETTPIAYPFNNLSASFSYSAGSVSEGYWIQIVSDTINLDGADGSLRAIYPNAFIQISFPVGTGNLVISDSNVTTLWGFLSPPAIGPDVAVNPADYPYAVELVVDDNVVIHKESPPEDNTNISQFNYSGTVQSYFALRFYWLAAGTDFVSIPLATQGPYACLFRLPYDIFTFEGAPLDVDQLDVVIGKLDSISGSVQEIQSQVVQINNNVVEIKDGLQDSNSSIWGAFKDAVSSVFVPSSADLEGVKDGFDQLAQDKLGGAYQTVELVDNGVKSVVDKFKNPGSSPGVEFPGISVPLGGDVGTVTLAASQTVTIPEQITSVLYPVAGVIIPIVCVIWTIRQCTDMVECFMSGMSYAEFLHRNSDEEDEEV